MKLRKCTSAGLLTDQLDSFQRALLSYRQRTQAEDQQFKDVLREYQHLKRVVQGETLQKQHSSKLKLKRVGSLSQVQPLSQQQLSRLSITLRNQQVQHFRQQLNGLSQQLNKLRQKYNKKKGLCVSLTQQLRNREQRLAAAQMETARKDSQLAQKEGEVLAAKSELAAVRLKSQQLNLTVSALQQQLQREQEKSERNQVTARQLEQSLQAITKEDRQDYKEHSALQERLLIKVQQLQMLNEALRRTQQANEAQLTVKDRELASCRSRIGQLQQLVKRLQQIQCKKEKDLGEETQFLLNSAKMSVGLSSELAEQKRKLEERLRECEAKLVDRLQTISGLDMENKKLRAYAELMSVQSQVQGQGQGPGLRERLRGEEKGRGTGGAVFAELRDMIRAHRARHSEA